VDGRNVADGTVETDVLAMLHVTLNQTPRTFERPLRARADALYVFGWLS